MSLTLPNCHDCGAGLGQHHPPCSELLPDAEDFGGETPCSRCGGISEPCNLEMPSGLVLCSECWLGPASYPTAWRRLPDHLRNATTRSDPDEQDE